MWADKMQFPINSKLLIMYHMSDIFDHRNLIIKYASIKTLDKQMMNVTFYNFAKEEDILEFLYH